MLAGAEGLGFLRSKLRMPFSPSRTSADALAACGGLRSLTAALRHAASAAQAIPPVPLRRVRHVQHQR